MAVTMDMSAVVMATGAAVLATHCSVFGFEVLSILRRAASAVFCDGKSNEQLEAALLDARIKQYRSSSRACMHIGAICTGGQMLHLQWNNNAHSHWPLLVSMSAWLMHLLISSNIVQLNRVRSKLFVLVMYAMVGVWVYGYPGDCQNALMLTSLTISVRFAVATFFVDFQIGVPAQSFLSLLETWFAWKRDPPSAHVSFLHQLTVLAFILVLAGLMEFHNRSRIALLTNSESMVMSFRRVLRGVCDGEILLDSKLRISGKAGCLQTLLMSSTDFCHTNFEELLMEDERERFRSFMFEKAAASGISAPPCLRVSLKRPRSGSSSSSSSLSSCRVGVDLFHVPHMLGEETYHLIALREDSDSRAPLEVIGADGNRSVHSPQSPDTARRSARSLTLSDSSISQVSGNSLMQICKELQEMTLLVDAATPLLDVEQAHLSFVRRADSDADSMPCLRRLVQPTDWGTIHAQLLNFSATREGKEVLKTKLRLQDDLKRCVQAGRVQVSAFCPHGGHDATSGRKLCLQLDKFKVVKPSQKQKSELKEVFEGPSEDSDHE